MHEHEVRVQCSAPSCLDGLTFSCTLLGDESGTTVRITPGASDGSVFDSAASLMRFESDLFTAQSLDSTLHKRDDRRRQKD
jgi:hypothetical protein